MSAMPALIQDIQPLKAPTASPVFPVANPIRVPIRFSQNAQYPLDHVNISGPLYDKLFKDAAGKHASGLFAAIQVVSEMDLGGFQVFKVHVKDQLPHLSVEFNNMSHLVQFRSQITLESCYIVPVPQPPALNNIILSFPPEVYQLLLNISNKKLYDILMADADDEGCRIFKKNDSVRSLNGRVLHCEPVEQGLLSPSTQLTLVKHEAQLGDKKSGHVTKDAVFAGVNFSFKNYFDDDDDSDSLVTMSLEPLASRHHLCLPSSPDLKHDDEIFGFMKMQELGKIGVFSGDLVRIGSDETEGHHRYVRVFGFNEPNTFKENTLYISPVYLINLGSPRSVKLYKSQSPLPVPVAKKVTIARVVSPVTMNRKFQHLFLSSLKTYFESKNRIVSKGQLIPIPIDTILAESLNTDDSELPEIIPEGNCDSIAWFQVTSIDEDDSNSQFLIESTSTKMIQSGTAVVPPPSNDSEYYQYLRIGNPFPYLGLQGNLFPYAHHLAKLLKASIAQPALQSCIILHGATRGLGKNFLVNSVAVELGIHVVELDSYEVLHPGADMKTMGVIRGRLDSLVDNCSPLIVHLQHVEALVRQKDQQHSGNKQDTLVVKLSELIQDYLAKPGVIVVASTADIDNLSDVFRNKFKFEIELAVPSQLERFEIFQYCLHNLNGIHSVNDTGLQLDVPMHLDQLSSTQDYTFKLAPDVSVDSLALQSAGLTPRDLVSIVTNAKNLALEKLEQMAAKDYHMTSLQLYYLNGAAVTISANEFEASINDARAKFSDSIGAPKIPDVKWLDVGGLDSVKDEILDTIEMPLKHPELFANGLKKRSGILFYGPPGTGKTLLAKAILTNFSLNFFSVKGPELLNMYIGESEANVRKVFQKLRDSRPCVVFFDELDSVAPKRGNQGDSGGVMDRIVSQLLAELDGMSSNGGDGVFVVGATNRPDLLDDALLRPGRFDKMLYLGISDSNEKQAKILQALTRKFQVDPDLDLNEIAASCGFNFTGADFYALCSDSILNAMIRLSTEVDAKVELYNRAHPESDKINTRYYFDKLATPADIQVVVKREDFIKALNELSPSVSQEELDHYLNIKRSFERN